LKESIASFRRRLKTDRSLAFLREDVIYFEHRQRDLNDLKRPLLGEENYDANIAVYQAKKKDIERGLDKVFKGINAIAQDVLKDRYPAIRRENRALMIRLLHDLLGDEPLFNTKEDWDYLYYRRDRPEYNPKNPSR
jgi:hypothetical protein